MDARGTAAHEWSLWSTTARLVVTDPAALPVALREAEELLHDVELGVSRFRADSELRRLARRPAVRGVQRAAVSAMTATLVQAALDVAEATDGAVDPTVGRALHDLGYDRDITLVLDPGADARRPVARIRPVPGWRRVRLSGDLLEVPEGVELDLGASAKAVAADLGAARIAERLGVGVLLSLGGDVATAGPAPEGGWQVGVQDGDDQPGTQIALPDGGGVATSSTLRRAWLRGGRRVHHIVDPATGGPAPSTWRTVSVAAARCQDANALSTAVVVRGEAGVALVERWGLPARLVDAAGRVTTYGGWPADQEVAA